MFTNYRTYSSRNMYSNFRYNNTFNNKQKVRNNFSRTNLNNKKIINENLSSKKDDDDTNILFNILGFDIHFDDFLLLSILIFLYKENIKDDYLFITLILLLLN